MLDDKLTPFQILAACFGLSSLAGVAALLRSNKILDPRTVIAAFLYSGLFGLVIGLVWFNYFAPANHYFLVGVSGLAGLGGVSLIDVLVQLITRGVSVKIHVDPDNDATEVDNAHSGMPKD